ncbi:MAG: diguanylate cyclase, partial [Gammaproteobacteria bacterium]|nr:diguanylate cyclase [Gammaproteobacteria bacterium]
DEICFVMTDFYSTSVLDHLARDLFRNFKRGIWVVDKRVNIDIACGIVMAPQHGRTASELLKKADVALSSATEKLPCQIYKG